MTAYLFNACLHFSILNFLEHVVNLDLARSLSKLDEEIEKSMTRLVGDHGEGVMYSCQVCQRTYKDKTKMKHHIETHLDSFHICPICSQQCKTRRTLKTHIARAHGNVKLHEHFPDTSFSQ